LRSNKNDHNIPYIDVISECLNRKSISYVAWRAGKLGMTKTSYFAEGLFFAVMFS